MNLLNSSPVRIALVAATLGVAVLAAPGPAGAGKVEYNRDLRPILSDTCFHCHGPDKNTRKAKLRLDVREDALKPGKSGEAAIVPGKPEESEVIRRLFTTVEDDLMPPSEAHKTLTAAQKELFRRWIAEGAEYQPHWAYLPPARPPVPAVAADIRRLTSDLTARDSKPQSGGKKVQSLLTSAATGPIDAFVRAKLAEHGVAMSPTADRRTLLRRVSLDLTGLPPTPADVEVFVADRSPDAYAKQVERLLASPHFGERMAVPWLDLVRFADTVGYHGDQNANVFPYRDYVIAAFNDNKPFDQFTREQLAGDLLPNPTVEARIATGFNRLNMMTREGGAQPKEYLAKYAADRVRTVSMAWLGSTMGCCECHDHKFDPFTQKDFYSLAAFFADVRQWGVYSDYDYTPNPDLKGWSNDHPFPPELEVENQYLKLRAARFADQMEAITRSVAATTTAKGANHDAFAAWEQQAKQFLQTHLDGWTAPRPEPTSATTNAVVSEAGEIAMIRPEQDGDKVGLPKVRLPLPPGGLAAIRIELLPAGTNGLTREGKSTVFRPAFLLARGTNAPVELAVHHAEATLDEPRYANGHEFIGIRDGWKTSARRAAEPQSGVWVLTEPVPVQDGDALVVDFRNNALERARIAVTPFAAANPLRAGGNVELADALAKPAAKRSERDRLVLAETWLLSSAADRPERERFQATQWDYLNCRAGRTPTLVTAAWEPLTIRVLGRGNWMDESGEVVSPNPPAFLPRAGLPADRRLTRLDLANWIVSPENPLTARVFANRLWKQFFGNGLSAQIEDLGAQGEWPTHPELLDWLAVEFRQPATEIPTAKLKLPKTHAWDVKHLVRLIVNSDAYKQSSNLRPETREADPNNRWLASQNPRRLEAEFVRDNALFIAGLLNPEVGGPSAFPYQPAGYYVNIQFPDRDYIASPDERQYRRGLYAHWQRTFLNPMLANFDAPSREECTATRPVSNTPQQALTLLNDPAFVEASRAFAERLLGQAATTETARLDAAFEYALSRPAKPAETKSLVKFLADQRTYYGANPVEASKFLHVGNRPVSDVAEAPGLAAWTQVARVILNLHETITRY